LCSVRVMAVNYVYVESDSSAPHTLMRFPPFFSIVERSGMMFAKIFSLTAELVSIFALSLHSLPLLNLEFENPTRGWSLMRFISYVISRLFLHIKIPQYLR
jgi:hypothetical protein